MSWYLAVALRARATSCKAAELFCPTTVAEGANRTARDTNDTDTNSCFFVLVMIVSSSHVDEIEVLPRSSRTVLEKHGRKATGDSGRDQFAEVLFCRAGIQQTIPNERNQVLEFLRRKIDWVRQQRIDSG